jgi:hypothetical protein
MDQMKPLIILQQVLHKISNMSGMRQLNQLFTQLAWKTQLFYKWEVDARERSVKKLSNIVVATLTVSSP